MSNSHNPKVIFIGCVDARVNPEDITGLQKGDVFSYFNISNTINKDSIEFISFLEYGINHLNLKKIYLCGHTDCGGINAIANINNINDSFLKKYILSLPNELNNYCNHNRYYHNLIIQSKKLEELIENNFKNKDIEIISCLYDVKNKKNILI
jgi:carbonic anhydrase